MINFFDYLGQGTIEFGRKVGCASTILLRAKSAKI